MRRLLQLSGVLVLALPHNASAADAADEAGFGPDITFYASFDHCLDADFALGDARLYSTSGQEEIREAVAGLGNTDRVVLAEGQGVAGRGSLEFTRQSGSFVFFPARDNVAYSQEGWSGTVSFSLKVDPINELPLTYTDPLQLTDANYNDSAIWVDFTDKLPREFRLGMVPDKPKGSDANNHNGNRTLAAKTLPFTSEKWTQVTITFSDLNTDHGSAQLYFDGELQASGENFAAPFTWDLDQARIRLGLGFVGQIDELVVLNRALNAEEVVLWHGLHERIGEVIPGS